MVKELVLIIFIYFVAVILAAFLWAEPYVLLLTYVVLSGAMFSRWHTEKDFIYFFSALVFGSLGELFASYYGAWTYAQPLFVIPVWLPVLWGIAALALMKLAKSLTEKI